MLGKLMKLMPGYRGYKKKEERRETDRIVREKAIRLLKESEDNMVSTLESAVNAGNKDLMKLIEKARGDIHNYITKIKTAEYGYTPGWNVVAIQEKLLEATIACDSEIILMAQDLKEYTSDINSRAFSNEDVTEQVRQVVKKMGDFRDKYQERIDIVSGTKQIIEME
ncbi:MAG: hypothetical protein HWN67_02780 [Candidatus Helarchaeota archaeon]|nr:hypothetical protein [Candidatus Helarchaeota archaeon]